MTFVDAQYVQAAAQQDPRLQTFEQPEDIALLLQALPQIVADNCEGADHKLTAEGMFKIHVAILRYALDRGIESMGHPLQLELKLNQVVPLLNTLSDVMQQRGITDYDILSADETLYFGEAKTLFDYEAGSFFLTYGLLLQHSPLSFILFNR